MHKQNDKIYHWILIESLGVGGNAEVWKARNTKDDLTYALKILKNSNTESEPFKRFTAEIEVLSRLGNRKGILPLLDFSLKNITRHSPAWLAMPIATPISKLEEALELKTAVEAIASISNTLSELATVGIHHRDLKPDNLYLYSGEWAIGDFGLVDYPDKEAITKNTNKLGPMYYIAPEMLSDPENANGELADVYSLSKTLWVLATGQKYPPPGEQRMEIKALTLSAYSKHPRAYLLDKLMDIATRHNPKERPTLIEFSAELSTWLNPSQAVDSVNNLSNVASQILTLMEPHKRAAERYGEQEERVKDLLNRFSDKLQPLIDLLKKADLPVMDHPAENSTIVERIQHNTPASKAKVLTKRGISIVVHTPHTYIDLWSGVGIERLDNECVNIIAAHIARSYAEQYHIVWSDIKPSILLGSAQEDVAVIDLINGLSINLAKALEHYSVLLDEARHSL